MKVLVILPNYIGDVLMTTPAIRLLKKINPESHITALVSERAFDIIKNNPYIDRIITRKNKLKLTDRLKILSEIKSISSRFDTAISFRSAFFDRILISLINPHKRTYVQKKEMPYKENCLTAVMECFAENSASENISEQMFGANICSGRTFVRGVYQMEIYISKDDESVAEQFITSNNLDKFCVINPVASRPSKMWDIKNYSILVDEIQQRYKLQVVLIGSQDDLTFCEIVYKNSINKPVIATGKLTLLQTTALIKFSELFISPDTGPLHISVALGKNTVGLFGSTDPKKYGPYPDNCKIIYNKVDCSPCYKNVCPLDKEKNICMKQITSKDVIEKISEFNF